MSPTESDPNISLHSFSGDRKLNSRVLPLSKGLFTRYWWKKNHNQVCWHTFTVAKAEIQLPLFVPADTTGIALDKLRSMKRAFSETGSCHCCAFEAETGLQWTLQGSWEEGKESTEWFTSITTTTTSSSSSSSSPSPPPSSSPSSSSSSSSAAVAAAASPSSSSSSSSSSPSSSLSSSSSSSSASAAASSSPPSPPLPWSSCSSARDAYRSRHRNHHNYLNTITHHGTPSICCATRKIPCKTLTEQQQH